ncbi:MAG: PQQ-binding-like beta-propeller repeat protein, partial [Planctomycetes bacterium]|nr:PQQ-binding-like beta-propeller repeat protein [Planctomycetota bacterium]
MKPHRLLPILVLAAVFHRESAWGQDAGQKSIFPPTSDAYQVLWRRLDGLAREESWESVLEGLRELAALHQRPEENPVVSSGAGYSVGIRRLAARFLDRMPAEQRRRHIDYADGLIEKAWEATRGRIDGADRARLRRAIVRDYPDSRFRAAALKEEIDSALLAGSWDRARLAAEELERTWSRSPTPPDVLERIQARLCLLLSQQALGTEAPWREARRSLLSLLDGEGLDPGSLPPQWRDLAQSVVDGRFPAPGAPLEKRAYSALRPDVGTRRPGAESREPGAEERSFRIGGVVWRPDEPASELRRFLSERSRSRDGAAIPRSCVPIPYHAASRGSLVVFQHDHQVMAVDLESRRQRWAFILPLALLPYNAVRSPACSAGRCYFSHGSSLYSVDLESGAPLWQRSLRYDRAERRLVLVEDDEGAPDDDDAPAAGGPPRDEPAGLDAQPRAEGDEHPPPETSGRVPVYEISPAVVVEGEIIVAATVRLDRESLVYLLRVGTTGEIVWSAYLGSAQSCGFLGLAATGSTPAVLDETVYHLSHQGFLAAADARDGTIAWILEYPVVSPQAEKEAIRDENRWHPSPVLPLPDGEILIAPQDSPLLMAVRRRDGAIVWRAERQQHSAILGCDERRCYLSGWQVSAVSIEAGSRGSLLWSRSLDETADSPLGIGLYRPGQLLVSTHRALLEIHPETGDLVRRDLWAFPGGGGNLLLAGEHLAVVHPGGCMVYNGYEAEVAHLERLPADPAETPLLQARLRLRVGDVETGLAFLESWAEAPPPAPELNSPMDRLRLELSEIIAEAAAAAEPALAARLLRARVQVEHAAWRKVEAAIQLADHLERSGDRAGAVDALYLALAADFPPTQHTVEGGGAEFRIDAATFIRDRILSLRRAEPDPAAAFAAIETKAEEQLEEAYRSGRSRMGKTSVAYLELLRRFPFTRAAAQAYLDLATFYGDYRNHENAARCLLEYLEEF